MPTDKGGSRTLIAVRVTALVPLLWFLLVGAIGKATKEADWVPIEAWVWPLMAAPVVLTVFYVQHRGSQGSGLAPDDVPSACRIAAWLFLIVNCAAIIYSWVAVIPAALSAGILLDGLLKNRRKEAK
jgi:hypothetical protein